MTISVSLRRAKENKLLNGLSFYSTQNVVPPFESLHRIVESAGGEVRNESYVFEFWTKMMKNVSE